MAALQHTPPKQAKLPLQSVEQLLPAQLSFPEQEFEPMHTMVVLPVALLSTPEKQELLPVQPTLQSVPPQVTLPEQLLPPWH